MARKSQLTFQLGMDWVTVYVDCTQLGRGYRVEVMARTGGDNAALKVWSATAKLDGHPTPGLAQKVITDFAQFLVHWYEPEAQWHDLDGIRVCWLLCRNPLTRPRLRLVVPPSCPAGDVSAATRGQGGPR